VAAALLAPSAAFGQASSAVTAEFLDAVGAAAAIGVPVGPIGLHPGQGVVGTLVDVRVPAIGDHAMPTVSAVTNVRLSYSGPARVRVSPALWLVIEHGSRASGVHTILALASRRQNPDAEGRHQLIGSSLPTRLFIDDAIQHAVNLSRERAPVGRVFIAVPVLELGTRSITAHLAEIER
jgi:hypothetical protein